MCHFVSVLRRSKLIECFFLRDSRRVPFKKFNRTRSIHFFSAPNVVCSNFFLSFLDEDRPSQRIRLDRTRTTRFYSRKKHRLKENKCFLFGENFLIDQSISEKYWLRRFIGKDQQNKNLISFFYKMNLLSSSKGQ